MRWHSVLKIGRIWMPSAESCAAFTTGPGLRLIDQWKREHLGSSISFVWLFLPVSLSLVWVYLRGKSDIYCESRSCYALDAFFILFFFLKYLFSLAGMFAWSSAVCAFFLLQFHFHKWYDARVNYGSSSRVRASSVQLVEECLAMKNMENIDFLTVYRYKTASDERTWWKIG